MPKDQDRGSTDDFLIPVSLVIPDGANPVTTEDPLWFAFTLSPNGLRNAVRPADFPTGWDAGFWLTTNGQMLAGILVGPENGGKVLSPGKWAAWLRIGDNPTVPQGAVDLLTIT